MTIKLIFRAFYAIVLLFFVLGCGGEKKEDNSSSNTPEKEKVEDSQESKTVKEKALLTAPKPTSAYDAYRAISRYRSKINSNNLYADYVWGELDSLQAMINDLRSSGKTHFKMYFGLDERTNCGTTSNNLNIIFEGAVLASPCNPDNCESCQLNEDPVGEGYSKTYNLNHPCPPPRCSGRSRYYFYDNLDKGKLRNKPE